MNVIEQKIQSINELCKQYRVNTLFAFGSAISDCFNDQSDVDLLVDMQPMTPEEKGETLLQLWDALEKLFARRVDLLTEQSLKNQYLRKNIERTKHLIYERGNPKAA